VCVFGVGVGGGWWEGGVGGLVLGFGGCESWGEWLGMGGGKLGRRGEVFVRRDFWLKRRLVWGGRRVGELERRLAKFVSGGAKSASLLARFVRRLGRFVSGGVKNVDNFGELGRRWGRLGRSRFVCLGVDFRFVLKDIVLGYA